MRIPAQRVEEEWQQVVVGELKVLAYLKDYYVVVSGGPLKRQLGVHEVREYVALNCIHYFIRKANKVGWMTFVAGCAPAHGLMGVRVKPRGDFK